MSWACKRGVQIFKNIIFKPPKYICTYNQLDSKQKALDSDGHKLIYKVIFRKKRKKKEILFSKMSPSF